MPRTKVETTKAPKSKEITTAILTLQKRQFDPNTGKPLWKPYDCTFNTKRDLEQFIKFPGGLTVMGVKALPKDWPKPEVFRAD